MYIAKYKDLLGVEVKQTLIRYKEDVKSYVIFDVYIAAIDYKKGITGKYINPNDEVGGKHEGNSLCLNRKNFSNKLEYNETFNRFVKEIREGHLKRGSEPYTGYMASCAFK